jgi:hypothetical protein
MSWSASRPQRYWEFHEQRICNNETDRFDTSCSNLLQRNSDIPSVSLKALRRHWKKPRMPVIRRTRAGVDLYCRPYGGRCQTRTDTCRPAPCPPSGTKHVSVWHWPVLDQTGRPTGRQDRLPGRHMLRHCYWGRSQAGSNDMYLQLPDLCRHCNCLGRQLWHRAAHAQDVQVPAPTWTIRYVRRHYAATHRHLNIYGYGSARLRHGTHKLWFQALFK